MWCNQCRDDHGDDDVDNENDKLSLSFVIAAKSKQQLSFHWCIIMSYLFLKIENFSHLFLMFLWMVFMRVSRVISVLDAWDKISPSTISYEHLWALTYILGSLQRFDAVTEAHNIMLVYNHTSIFLVYFHRIDLTIAAF